MCCKTKIHFFLFWSLTLFLFSCRKPEIAVKPAQRGDALTSAVDMGSDYKQQIYFSLSQNSVMSTNLKTSWDIGFETLSEGFHLVTNSAKAMSVCNTGKTDFYAVNDTLGFSKTRAYDSPTGNMDSTAFGDWRIKHPVYLVDRGYNETGIHQGFKKIQILSLQANAYTFKVADVNGKNEWSSVVQKNRLKNFVCFSLTSNAVVNIEPDKETYDLLFTQYTHLYHNPFSTYLVTGVLLNPNNIKVAPVSDISFSAISINDTLTHPFNTFQNAIGFDWKTFNFTTSTYTVDLNKCFIIKDTKGYFYKLHFIDFYNSSGLKGHPKMEFKKI